MTLTERLSEYVSAAFSGIWVQTHEQEVALHEITQLAPQHGWTLATWDIDRGLGLDGRTTEVTGTGFPANATVTFALVPIGTAPTTNLNIVPGVRTTTTNGIGAFTNQIMVLMPHTAIGGYEILATATTVNATTPFLITPGTEQPPKFVDRH